MVGRFLILILLILGGTSLADTSSTATEINTSSEIPIEPLINSFSTALETEECGIDCELLLQKISDSNEENQESINSDFDSLYNTLIAHYQSIYKPGAVYLTMKQMKEEIKFQEDTLTKMQATGTASGNSFYSGIITELSNSITDYKSSLEKMETEHLVLVVENSETSYISIDDYKYELKKQSKESNVESLLKVSMTSSELFELHDALSELYSILRTDDTCSINQAQYTYNDLSAYIDSVQDLAQETEHQESLQTVVDTITIQYTSAGQYWVKSEVKEFMEAWDSLVKTLKPDESVTIMSVSFDLPSSKEKYAELKGIYQRIHLGEVATFNDKGELDVIPTPLIKSSDTMTGADYMDLIKATASRNKNVPVLKSDEKSSELANDNQVMLQFTGANEPNSFLQVGKQEADESLNRDAEDYPENPAKKGNEYYDGESTFLLVTSFLADSDSTGKVYAFDTRNPETYYEILRGFNKPTGCCYDVNHEFLYVVENGGDYKGIYQFQMNRDENTIEFRDSVYSVVYDGSPLDCKVDAYGNLYFTEESDQSIRKMTYSDLYFVYANADIILYSNVEGLDTPGSIELRNSKDLYFVNTGSSGTNGTVNLVNVQNSDSDDSEIQILIQDNFKGQGLAVNKETIYYSLDGGTIKSYSIATKEIQTYSRELTNPVGLCTSNHKVFAMDYSAGTLYVGEDLLSENMEVFAYVQAPYSCFCLNYKDSSFAANLILGLATIFLL